MNRHFRNALYGALDYAAYPLGMLLVAPVVLRRLGVADFGIWMIATAVISVGGIIASGFGDANIQRIAALRGKGDHQTMILTVCSALAIHTVLGSVLAASAWIAGPYAVARIVVAQPALAPECLVDWRIASLMILVRAVESVAVSTLRGFEAFRESVQVSTMVRLATLAAAGFLALAGFRSVSILIATSVFLVMGTALQFLKLSSFLKGRLILPAFDSHEGWMLMRTGVFSWIHALGGVVLGQLDRLLLGVSLGAVAVAPYALCVQFAQPLSGLTASSLQFLFPHLSNRASEAAPGEVGRTILNAFLCNLLIVAGEVLVVLAIGPHLVRVWAGPRVAEAAVSIFPLIIFGTAFLGLGVTATYALLALGMFRTVTTVSLFSRLATLLLMFFLLPHFGLKGLAISRLCCGVLTLLLYVPLLRRLAVPNPIRLVFQGSFAEGRIAKEKIR